MQNLKARELSKNDLSFLSDREKLMYPDPDNEIPERYIAYEHWVNPKINLSSIFENEVSDITGIIVVVPVSKKGWEYINDQTDYDLNEYELIGTMLFDPKRDHELGFYIYVIEKLDKSIKNFTEIAYRQMFRNLKTKFESFNKPKILGLSEFSVSVEAIHIALNKLNKNESKRLAEYMFYDPKGNLVVKMVRSQSEYENLLKIGYQLRNRARLTFTTPNDPSIVWSWYKEETGVACR